MNIELSDLNEKIRRISSESARDTIIRIYLFGVLDQIVGALPRYVTYEQYIESLEAVLEDYGMKKAT